MNSTGGTPDSILQKPSRLTSEEFENMKKHARQGGHFDPEMVRAFMASKPQVERFYNQQI